MDELIQLITGGVDAFTPTTVVGLIVFFSFMECIGQIAGFFVKGAKG